MRDKYDKISRNAELAEVDLQRAHRDREMKRPAIAKFTQKLTALNKDAQSTEEDYKEIVERNNTFQGKFEESLCNTVRTRGPAPTHRDG